MVVYGFILVVVYVLNKQPARYIEVLLYSIFNHLNRK